MSSFTKPSEENSSELCKDVVLYTTRENPPNFRLKYEVECKVFNVLQVEFDFTGSNNITSANPIDGNNLIFRQTVGPFKRKEICQLIMKDPKKGGSLQLVKRWSFEEPSADIIAAYFDQKDQQLFQMLDWVMESNLNDESLPVSEITTRCLKAGTHYIDPVFPPQNSSLFKDSNGNVVFLERKIDWRRPREYLDGPYKVFDGIIEPADIKQGNLGDCWFLSALASLAEFPMLVRKLFLTDGDHDAPNPAGVYKMRFCKGGQWREVLIDDLFPCYISGGPIYSRCHGNEIWVQLIEKAYAKLHGSYALIRAGFAYEAMIDLTGAPFEKIHFSDEDVQNRIRSGELWAKLRAYDRLGHLMSASTPGEDHMTEIRGEGSRSRVALVDENGRCPSGLIAGHAYSLITVADPVSGPRGLKLIQLRNPWGSQEWKGDWSDKSPLWTTSLRIEVGAKIEDDGTFWMCFEDLLSHFDSLNVCMCRGGTQPWVEQRRRGAFHYKRRHVLIGYISLRNTASVETSMYELQVKQAGRYFVSLHQQDERIAGAPEYLDMGIAILKLRAPGRNQGAQLVEASPHPLDRQIQISVDLQPGSYMIVPTSPGCRFQALLQDEPEREREQAETPTSKPAYVPLFQTRSKGSLGKGLSGGDVAPLLSAEALVALDEVFCSLDYDCDGYMGRLEINAFLALAFDDPKVLISDNAWSDLLTSCESLNGELTRLGFEEAFVSLCVGRNLFHESSLWTVFENLGFNKQLQSVFARPFFVAVHSESSFDIRLQLFDAALFKDTMTQAVVRFGSKKDIMDGKVFLYTHKAGYSGVSFAVENLLEEPILFEHDCSSSRNTFSHRGDLKSQDTVQPRDTVITHHLSPSDKAGWSWTYSASMYAV